MKISARNALPGKIKSITRGAVNAEIVIELADGLSVTSVITLSSVDRLDLREGADAYAVVKASDVMIAVDE